MTLEWWLIRGTPNGLISVIFRLVNYLSESSQFFNSIRGHVSSIYRWWWTSPQFVLKHKALCGTPNVGYFRMIWAKNHWEMWTDTALAPRKDVDAKLVAARDAHEGSGVCFAPWNCCGWCGFWWSCEVSCGELMTSGFIMFYLPIEQWLLNPCWLMI